MRRQFQEAMIEADDKNEENRQALFGVLKSEQKRMKGEMAEEYTLLVVRNLDCQFISLSVSEFFTTIPILEGLRRKNSPPSLTSESQ